MREYATGTWASTFYPLHEVRIQGLGLVNEDNVFFATRHGVSLLRDGFLTHTGLKVPTDSSITAFHLCHHRGSFFYEVWDEEGTLVLNEYSLATRQSVRVKGGEFQDSPPATSLACVDNMLLRTSPSEFLALRLSAGVATLLQRFHGPDDANQLTALTVGYAADVVSRAEIYAVAPLNRSVVRIRLQDDGAGLSAQLEEVIPGGTGDDGPQEAASLLEPHDLVWCDRQVHIIDGCSLRRLSNGTVSTILGSPELCTLRGNETLEPAPWNSRLTRLQAIASTGSETSQATILLLTESQVVSLQLADSLEPAGCAALTSRSACQQSSCAWAEGSQTGEQLCLPCTQLETWASHQRPAVDLCSLEEGQRAGTWYSLSGCGCIPPETTPSPFDPDESGGEAGLEVMATILVLTVGLAAAVLMYRAHRRAAHMRQFSADTAEFHIFTDDEAAY